MNEYSIGLLDNAAKHGTIGEMALLTIKGRRKRSEYKEGVRRNEYKEGSKGNLGFL